MKNQFFSFKYLLLGLCLVLHFTSNAQNITETQWFFGNSPYNFQVDKNGDILYLEERMGLPFGTGGSAVISDHLTGNLRFYSDGQQVFDASHQLISSTLSGNPAINQPAIACPVPNSNGRYFLFTNSGAAGVDEIQYTVLDGNVLGNGNATVPLGGIASENNPTGLTDPSEGMILIPGRANMFFWLITQNRSSFDFTVSRIEDGGITSQQVFELDTITRPGFEVAQFAFNSDSSWLAMAPKTANRNILIANFNDSSGVLSFERTILNTGFNDDQGEAIYDVEWSPSGNRLFFSRFGANETLANLYAFDFLDSTETVTEVLEQPLFRSLGLKKAIDDKIYHLYQTEPAGPFEVAVINNPNDSLENLDYQEQLFDVDLGGRQFPAFAPAPFFQFQVVDFTYLDSCQNDATKFFPVVSPTPTSYFWDFGPGGISTNVAPIVTFDAASSIFVSLTVSLNQVDSTILLPVEILANETTLQITDQNDQTVPQDTVICIDEFLTLNAQLEPQAAATFIWNTGETGSQIEVDTAGNYWVQARLPNGCTAFGSVNVTEYGLQQQTANQWYFGEMAGIDFNQQPPAAITDNNMMFSPEGCATISDENGDLLFYTNGVTVWTRDHNIMANGTDIGGDSTAAQGTIILPFSDDETMFYIFTAQEVYGDLSYNMTYSIVDIKEDQGQGAVVLKNLPFFENSIEKVTSSGFTGTFWLSSHEFGNNSFRTNLISADGIGPTFFSPSGTELSGTDPSFADGYMRFFPGAANYANLISGTGIFEILDFVDTVGGGRMVNARQIDTEETSPLYGLEFTGDGLVAVLSTANTLFGYRLDSLNTDNEIADILATRLDGPTGNGFGALQRGPDGQIYFAQDNAGNVLTITVNEDNISTNPFDLQGRISRLGLPNFTQQVGSPSQLPGLNFENACLGQDVIFTASGTSIIDEFDWDFGPNATPTGSIADSVGVQYDTTGVFDVTLRIYNRCAEPHDDGRGNIVPPLPPPFSFDSTLNTQVEVFTVPELPMVPDDTSLCNGPVVLTAWDVDREDLNYYWSNGDTTREVTITEPQQLQVAIFNDQGCSSDTIPIFIGDGRPQIDLGPDQAVCQFDDLAPLDAQNVQVFYQWTINGEGVNDSRFQPVATDTSGIYEYAIRVEEPQNACVGTDTIQITVREIPDVSTDFTPPSTCGISDASLAFSINSSGSFLYSLINPDTSIISSLDGPGSPPRVDSLGIGTYNLTVENLVTGCDYQEGIFVENDVLFDLSASNLPDCNTDVSMQLTLTGASLPERTDVFIANLQGDTVFSDRSRIPPLIISPALDSGLYFVTVSDVSNNCAQVDSVLVRPIVAGAGDCLPRIIAPNAFSPNGNGANEEFYIIPNPYIDQFSINIYTRWGELVYYSENINFRWDGRFDNKVLPVGTYAYIIRYTSIEDPGLGTQVQYGAVTLVR